MKERIPKIAPVVFLCSFSSLAYEIALTRIFSISLWYHFAFMIISIAMLGLGASGTILAVSRELKKPTHIPLYSVLLGAGISMSYLISNRIPFDPVRLSWEKIQLLYIVLYYLTLSLPFFFTGLIIAAAFSSMSEKSGLLYASDLLGAGTGSMTVLSLMTFTGPERTVFVLSSLALVSSFIINGKRLKAASLLLILLNLYLFLAQPPFTNLRMSPYKGLEMALRFPGAVHLKTYYSPFSRIDAFNSPANRFAPGLSLRYLDPLPDQTGLSIDGGELNAVTTPRDRESLAFLRYLPSALPYEVARKDDVLVLDPKGGLQVLVAEHYGAKHVYKVESNPLLIRIIRDDFESFSGGLYRRDTWQGLGRSWLETREREFDIIDISLTGATPSGSFGISEDYRFTVEAFEEYLGYLKRDGILSMSLFILPPPRMELRILTAVIEAMERLNIPNAEEHIAAIRSWDSICFLVKKSPFTPGEIGSVRKFSSSRRFDMIHYPGIREHESNIYIRMVSNDYFTAFKTILDPAGREGFIARYLFDIRPVSDDSPFFHHYLKLKNIGEIYRIMGEKWQYFAEEGYLLPAVFIQVLFLSLLLIGIPAFAGRKGNDRSAPADDKKSKGLLPYFALLGIGYMFVEIVLIHRTILPLENPSYAVATVLASMLISSGAGSLMSYRSPGLRSPLVTVVVAALVLSYSLLLPLISKNVAPAGMPVKITAIFTALMPLGFFMGIPFPTGLKTLGEREPALIPWAWAINGCLSVLAPILTVVVALTFGFRSVLWLGALAYAMAYIVIVRYSRTQRTETERKN